MGICIPHTCMCWGGLLYHHKGVFVIGIGVCWEHLLCLWVCLDVDLWVLETCEGVGVRWLRFFL